MLGGQALIAHEAHEAARAIAALFDFTAVGVEDAITEINPGGRGRLDQHHLVGADTEVPVGQQAPLLGLEPHALAHAVEHDKIVAGALHLGELQLHDRIIADTQGAHPAGGS